MATTSITAARYQNDARRNIEIECVCGCGKKLLQYQFYWSPSIQRYTVKKRRFIHGHNGKLLDRSKEYREKISNTLKGHVISQETREKIRRTLLRGRLQVSSVGKLRLSTRKWQKIRKLVYERDNYQCQECGVKCVPKSRNITNRTIQAHHIVRWSKTQDDSLENLITLCVSCHKMVEHKLQYD